VRGRAQPEGDLTGRTLGSYRVLQALGSGGMSDVYLAEDVRLGRRVALKVLPPETAEDPEKVRRFEREARAIASLSHPGIVVLHSIEETEGLRFLTMEHVQGETLNKAIPPRGLPLDLFLSLAIALVDAVSAAHRQGILHRDLKPENVMLTAEGRLKVLDFGLAKLRADARDEPDRTTRETQSITRDGWIVGTVAYMSPEQAQGLSVDHRSDIFALGILLYEMATGERPFKGSTNLSVLSSILRDDPPPASALRADIPRPLARMIERALEKRPEDRYQSAIDLCRDLRDLKRDVDAGEMSLATRVDRPVVTAAEQRRHRPRLERRQPARGRSHVRPIRGRRLGAMDPDRPGGMVRLTCPHCLNSRPVVAVLADSSALRNLLDQLGPFALGDPCAFGAPARPDTRPGALVWGRGRAVDSPKPDNGLAQVSGSPGVPSVWKVRSGGGMAA
jgi:serine/threonine protein kinase